MQPMTHTHSLKILTRRQAEQRRRELETGILHLIDQDNGPQDLEPNSYEINLEQRALSPDGFETMQRLKGRVAGGMLDGKAEFVRTQEIPFDAGPDEHWNIDYASDSIICERWRGKPDSQRYYHSLEFISRQPEVDSYQIEWKLSS